MINIIGKKFGRLVPIKMVGVNKYNVPMWECFCDCGKKKITIIYRLINGDTQSCGCLARELLLKNHTSHGMTHTRFFKNYISIKQRCNNPKNHAFKYYGERGIKFLWKSFEDFRDDMYKPYLKHIEKFGEKQTSIDRIDVNGNYCKRNCRWATNTQQANNRTNNNKIKFKGEIHTLSEWAVKIGIKRCTIHQRLRYGWSINRTFTTSLYSR